MTPWEIIAVLTAYNIAAFVLDALNWRLLKLLEDKTLAIDGRLQFLEEEYRKRVAQ